MHLQQLSFSDSYISIYRIILLLLFYFVEDIENADLKNSRELKDNKTVLHQVLST